MTSPDGDHGDDHPAPAAPDNSPASWDRRYAELDRVWSGQPNGALVAEVGSLPPGRALDVGCGEGADAIWLARQGWEVTALDVSEVALQRAEQAAAGTGVAVRWVHAGLPGADLPPASFDLVSAQYPALLATPDQQAERALLSLVAPGGLLLVVHHALDGAAHAQSQGFDPRDYVAPGDVAALLDASWTLEVHETRPRSITGGAGAHHREDVVVRARRLR